MLKPNTHNLEKGDDFIGPMTPYTPLDIANIDNIDLIRATPLNIF